MPKTTRWWWTSVLTVGAIMIAFAGSNTAQDRKAHEKHDASALYSSLRDVINNGAKLFNEQGDHAGCYRLYQGSLLSVRPFLTPELQKKIDTGITSAEGKASFADRAFELRKVLDDVRNQVKPGGTKTEEKKKAEEKKTEEKKSAEKKEEKKKVEKKKEEKKTEEKKAEEKKKVEKKTEEKKAEEKKSAAVSEKGQIAGKILYQGKALAGGYFVTLISSEGKKFSSAIQKDGSFQLKTPVPAGDYKIVLEAIPGEAVNPTIPSRYRAEATSGLSVRVQSGRQQLDLNLVN